MVIQPVFYAFSLVVKEPEIWAVMVARSSSAALARSFAATASVDVACPRVTQVSRIDWVDLLIGTEIESDERPLRFFGEASPASVGTTFFAVFFAAAMLLFLPFREFEVLDLFSLKTFHL